MQDLKYYKLPVQNGDPREAMTELCRVLLEGGLIDALVVPQVSGTKRTVANTLVRNLEGLRSVDPLTPVAMVNAARVLADLSVGDAGFKVGAVLRSCEVRALVELVKLEQASMENLLVIGVDCLGTFKPVDFRGLVERNQFDLGNWLARAAAGGDTQAGEVKVRPVCSVCDHVTAEHAVITLGWVGLDPSRELLLGVADELAPLLAERLGLSEEEEPVQRKEFIARLKDKRAAAKQRALQEFEKQNYNLENLAAVFSSCIRCHNCRKVCPICFCRECVFESKLFEHRPEEYFKWASNKGLIELPTDALLFHLTRLNHMGLNCVGCGQCEAACPSDLPLGLFFSAAGKKLQKIFDYEPGHSVEEQLPLTTYQEVELEPR